MESSKSRTLPVALIAVGLVALIIGLGADAIGLGGTEGFGWKQMVLSLVGGAVAVAGVVLAVTQK